MATIINADTSNGLKLTSDTSGQLELQSAGSTKVTMDTSGNVGIGTSSPNKSSSSTALTVDAPVAANYAALELSSGETLNWHINANNADVYDVTAGTRNRVFYTNGAERMRITSGGAVGIGTTSPLTELNVQGGTGAASPTELTTRANAMFSLSSAGTGTRLYQGIENGNTVWLQAQNSDNSAKAIAINPVGGTLFLGQTSNPATGSMVIKVLTDTGNGINFQSTGTATSYAIGVYNNTGGNVGSISFSTTATAYNTSSDYRLKENVVPMANSIDRLKQLKPSTWAWVQDGSHGEGFLAHEAQEVVPESATGTKDAMRTEEYEVTPSVEATYDEEGNELTPAVEAVMGTREVPDYQGIDQSKLVPLLTAALQEAIQRIEALEAK